MRTRDIFDKSAAVTGLIVTSPVIILALAFTAATHMGNPILTQKRIGKNKEPFTIFKIKSMKQARDPLTKEKVNGVVVTRLGNILRRTKIDELPQLINVIKGDMRLVGPRPRMIGSPLQKDDLRHSVKPGMSGLAQIQGPDVLSYEEILKHDHRYVEERSLVKDFLICALTPFAILRNSKQPHFKNNQATSSSLTPRNG